MDYLEYENDKYLKNVKFRITNYDIKSKDEIENLEGWFKKNVKLKKELKNDNID